MASITIKQFGGSIPRMADHLLGAGSAAQALDCKLWHGRLESWREPLKVREYDGAVPVTAFYFDCCWFEYATCVDIAIGPVTCRKLFTTGDQAWPAVVDLASTGADPCIITTRRLGIPAAYAAPSVAAGSTAGTAPKDTEGRSYAYQYTNAAKERGALSRASEPVLVRDGQTVVVSGWDVPDASWGVTQVRIFRSVAAYQPQGGEKGNVFDTVWMLVGEAGINDASFTDSVHNENLLNALEEDIADPPPANLKGMVYVESMNTLAGFVGRRLYFSENNIYHHWPYHYDLDDNICGLVESNGVLYVATDGSPYAVKAIADEAHAGHRDIVRLPVAYPMVGCGNRRMAKTPFGAVYPSHDGMVALSGNNPPGLLTKAFYAPDDWQALQPGSVTPVVHQGKLFVFAYGGSFVMNLPQSGQNDWPLDTHSSLSDINVVDAFVTRFGDLYVLKPDGIYQWDRGTTLRPHQWVSGESVAPTPIGFKAVNLYHQHGAETVTVTVEGMQFSRQVLSAKAFTLPAWMLGTRWQIKLEGTATVSLVSLATSMQELGA